MKEFKYNNASDVTAKEAKTARTVVYTLRSLGVLIPTIGLTCLIMFTPPALWITVLIIGFIGVVCFCGYWYGDDIYTWFNDQFYRYDRAKRIGVADE